MMACDSKGVSAVIQVMGTRKNRCDTQDQIKELFNFGFLNAEVTICLVKLCLL